MGVCVILESPGSYGSYGAPDQDCVGNLHCIQDVLLPTHTSVKTGMLKHLLKHLFSQKIRIYEP